MWMKVRKEGRSWKETEQRFSVCSWVPSKYPDDPGPPSFFWLQDCWRGKFNMLFFQLDPGELMQSLIKRLSRQYNFKFIWESVVPGKRKTLILILLLLYQINPYSSWNNIKAINSQFLVKCPRTDCPVKCPRTKVSLAPTLLSSRTGIYSLPFSPVSRRLPLLFTHGSITPELPFISTSPSWPDFFCLPL